MTVVNQELFSEGRKKLRDVVNKIKLSEADNKE